MAAAEVEVAMQQCQECGEGGDAEGASSSTSGAAGAAPEAGGDEGGNNAKNECPVCFREDLCDLPDDEKVKLPCGGGHVLKLGPMVRVWVSCCGGGLGLGSRFGVLV